MGESIIYIMNKCRVVWRFFGYTSHKVGFEAKAKPWLETDEKSFTVD